MEMLSDTDWREHWLGLATDDEIARWRASALYEMEHDYTHAAMSDIYPMSRGILRILARYDALAREGITTGEDGTVRFHGLTGAEIEGHRKALQEIRAKAFEEDQYAWHHGVLEPGKPGWFWSTADAALAAAAGRGADGEAGE